MENSIDVEIWRQVPPEEKFEIMAKAQAKGILAAAITIVIASTVAVGLKLSWIMWASMVASPFIFQFAAGKEWRSLRPRTLLEYLAARSASRRFAFMQKSNDLTPKFIFKGVLEEVYENERVQEALEAMISNTQQAEVWVSLFSDTVVMIAERVGGAELKFGHPLDDKLTIEARGGDGRDYGSGKSVHFIVQDKEQGTRHYKLSSKYPAALLVFEKQAKAFQMTKGNLKLAIPELAETAPEDDGDVDTLFSFN